MSLHYISRTFTAKAREWHKSPRFTNNHARLTQQKDRALTQSSSQKDESGGRNVRQFNCLISRNKSDYDIADDINLRQLWRGRRWRWFL
jgi:hypothetical protein